MVAKAKALQLYKQGSSSSAVVCYLGDPGQMPSFFMSQCPHWDFPRGSVVKNLPANAGDTGSSPGLGRSHMPRSN